MGKPHYINYALIKYYKRIRIEVMDLKNWLKINIE